MPEIKRVRATVSFIFGATAYSMALPYLTIKAMMDLKAGPTALVNQTQAICNATPEIQAGGIAISIFALLPTAGFCMINLYKIFSETPSCVEIFIFALALSSSLQNTLLNHDGAQDLLFNCSNPSETYQKAILYAICLISWLAPAMGNAKALTLALKSELKHFLLIQPFQYLVQCYCYGQNTKEQLARIKAEFVAELTPLETLRTVLAPDTDHSTTEQASENKMEGGLNSPLLRHKITNPAFMPGDLDKKHRQLFYLNKTCLALSLLFAFELSCKSIDELASTFVNNNAANFFHDKNTLSTISTFIGKTAWSIASLNTGFLINRFLIRPIKPDIFSSELGWKIVTPIILFAIISAFPYGSVPLLQLSISPGRKFIDTVGMLVSCFVFSAYSLFDGIERAASHLQQMEYQNRGDITKKISAEAEKMTQATPG